MTLTEAKTHAERLRRDAEALQSEARSVLLGAVRRAKEEGATLEAIGQELGLTKQRVGQLLSESPGVK